MARGIIVLDEATFLVEIKLGTLPDGSPAIPRLRILIDGHVAAESYWQGTPDQAAVDQPRYVYPGEKGGPPLLLPPGAIEFRVQARERMEVLVPLDDEAAAGWIYERTDDGGITWQPIQGALPIRLRKF